MKRYRIDIKPTAEKDLERRFTQIEKHSPESAVNWYLGLIDAIKKLDVLPQRCPIAPENRDIQRGIRHLVVGDYRVLYVIDEDVVSVLHIRHGRHDRKL